MSNNKYFMIKNARVSFPDIFEVYNVNGDKGNYGATLLLTEDQHADMIKELNGEIENIIKTKLKGAKVPKGMRCLRDGSESTRAEYDGYFTLSTRSDDRPRVFKPGSKEQAENMSESGIYSGCYVDAKIYLWDQDNSYGKRVNARLVAIRFAEDGDAFGVPPVPIEEAVDGFEVSADSLDDIIGDDELAEAA